MWYILGQNSLLSPIIPSLSFKDILTGVGQSRKYLQWESRAAGKISGVG